MGKDTGFMEFTRETPTRRPVAERVNAWFEIYLDFPEEKIRKPGARCIDATIDGGGHSAFEQVEVDGLGRLVTEEAVGLLLAAAYRVFESHEVALLQ